MLLETLEYRSPSGQGFAYMTGGAGSYTGQDLLRNGRYEALCYRTLAQREERGLGMLV